MLNEQQIYLFGQIQTSQTGGQQYSDTSPVLWMIFKFHSVVMLCSLRGNKHA